MWKLLAPNGKYVADHKQQLWASNWLQCKPMEITPCYIHLYIQSTESAESRVWCEPRGSETGCFVLPCWCWIKNIIQRETVAELLPTIQSDRKILTHQEIRLTIYCGNTSLLSWVKFCDFLMILSCKININHLLDRFFSPSDPYVHFMSSGKDVMPHI